MVPRKSWNVNVSMKVLFVVVEFGFGPSWEIERIQGCPSAEEESGIIHSGPNSWIYREVRSRVVPEKKGDVLLSNEDLN